MKKLVSFLSWMVSFLIPVALIFLGLRLLLTNTFVHLEYRMPGFPEDSYGFSREDRFKWSDMALQYLVNNSGREFLGDLTFNDGTAVFNDRELDHMVDVKNVVKPVMVVGYSTWILIIIIWLVSFKMKWMAEFKKGSWRGGWIMIGFLLVIGAFAIINFWDFFTYFHGLFFEGDSWLFFYSDTLIRLFPIRFWQDAFLSVGLITLFGSLLLIITMKPKHKGYGS